MMVMVPSLLAYFYPRPPRGGRRSQQSEWQSCPAYFYPRPPRGGRQAQPWDGNQSYQISIHALREEGDVVRQRKKRSLEQFLSTPSARRATSTRASHAGSGVNFYPRPPRGGRPDADLADLVFLDISIHALREEGDSKNGEKHLRFCFIIKQSAQIWKSLSKNIRKKSRNLHRTA